VPVRRLAALATLVLLAAAVVVIVLVVLRGELRGFLLLSLVGLAIVAAWEGVRRRGPARVILLLLALALLVASVVVALAGRVFVDGLLVVALVSAAAVAQKRAFSLHLDLGRAERPQRPVVLWNAKSGGGKALAVGLADEARARGIEPIELKPGDDLEQLARDAVAGGADALAAAGGDGTQAIVASVAAEYGLPFACIPAGTRNHFALDLGVDRDDVVGALDAFVTGGERRVDLAAVNGRTFVNNVSLGLYAVAVQREGYRDAKLRTILDTVPDVLGPRPATSDLTLRWTGPDGRQHDTAVVVLVSNNVYRLGRVVSSGTRPRIDEGLLGIAVLGPPPGVRPGGRTRQPWWLWSTDTFEVDSPDPVPAGVDGEALVLDPPLRFTVRHRVLRVRIAPQHPGASPSAAQPEGLRDGVRMVLQLAAGRDPDAVLARRPVG
jgi:diacylglycerol kinase family enzyme